MGQPTKWRWRSAGSPAPGADCELGWAEPEHTVFAGWADFAGSDRSRGDDFLPAGDRGEEASVELFPGGWNQQRAADDRSAGAGDADAQLHPVGRAAATDRRG